MSENFCTLNIKFTCACLHSGNTVFRVFWNYDKSCISCFIKIEQLMILMNSYISWLISCLTGTFTGNLNRTGVHKQSTIPIRPILLVFCHHMNREIKLDWSFCCTHFLPRLCEASYDVCVCLLKQIQSPFLQTSLISPFSVLRQLKVENATTNEILLRCGINSVRNIRLSRLF